MKLNTYILGLFLILNCTLIKAQEEIHNFGNLQLHETAMVGFHSDFTNDGGFDQNLGLAGFYQEDRPITISGAFVPIFYDAEIAVDHGLILETSIGATNNVNLISGDIITPRNNTYTFANFLDNAFYTGENHVSLVDGYATITNKETFTFPIGIDNRYRPLKIESYAVNPLAKSAYFFEDPKTSSYFSSIYSPAKSTQKLEVSSKEFWHLEGEVISKVTLTWDEWSTISSLAKYLNELVVVGYSKELKEWVNLGNSYIKGGMAYGTITSNEFVPNDYEVITIGGSKSSSEEFSTIELDNYFLSPNGDGKNDYLVIDGIENSSNNDLQIYNRYGIMVYSQANYENEFIGISNRNSVINKGANLESGIYFYIIQLKELKQTHQGYLYLTY